LGIVVCVATISVNVRSFGIVMYLPGQSLADQRGLSYDPRLPHNIGLVHNISVVNSPLPGCLSVSAALGDLPLRLDRRKGVFVP
jgi:hypothetical protein